MVVCRRILAGQHARKVGAIRLRHIHARADQDRTVEVGAAEIAAGEIGVFEIGAGKICLTQIGAHEPAMLHHRIGEVGLMAAEPLR